MCSEYYTQPHFFRCNGVLYYQAHLPNIFTAVIIALSLAGLITVLAGAGYFISPPGKKYCAAITSRCLLLGILGTILTGTGALATDLGVSSVIDIILISFGAFFSGLMLLSFLQYLWCISISQKNPR